MSGGKIELRWLQDWVEVQPGVERLVGRQLQYRQVQHRGYDGPDGAGRDIWSDWEFVPDARK